MTVSADTQLADQVHEAFVLAAAITEGAAPGEEVIDPWGVARFVVELLVQRVAEEHPRARKPTQHRIGAALRKAVYERDAYRCQECGTWLDLTVDHVIPVALGGPTILENLQTLCGPCNSAKGVR